MQANSFYPMPEKPVKPPERPNVFLFLDARAFLAATFEYEKRINRAFSHRYIARMMGSTSSGFFKDILNGRVRISPARIAEFAHLFRLTEIESEHFEALTHYTQASNERDKERWLKKMTTGSRSGKNTLVEAYQLEYFQKWQYAAVRELLAIHDFRGDFTKLAALLEPAITPHEAEQAVRLLENLKLVRKAAHGRLERVDKIVRSGSTAPAWVKPAIRGNIELALRALDALPPAVRPFSYLTLSVSKNSLEHILQKLTSLRQELLDIAAQDAHADRLYQLNLQLFPISKTVKDHTP